MKSANAIEKFRRIERVALETLLGIAATLTLFCGVVCCAVSVLFAFIGLEILYSIAFTCLFLFLGVLGWGLLSAAAENLRVAKSSAGLEYSGKISGTHYLPYTACSECGARLLSLEICQCCGAEIVDVTEESNVGQPTDARRAAKSS